MSVKSSLYRVVLSQDRMSCLLEKTEHPVGACTNVSEVYKQLKDLEISFGIEKETIESVFNELNGVESVVIAQGRPVKHGEDGRIEVFVDLNSKPQFVPDEHAIRVDFKESIRFTLIKAGDLICKLHPPTYGVSGKDVTGREVVARRGAPETLKAAEGVREENGSYFAACSGRPNLENKIVKVLDILEIKGSVSLETGNIKYPGPVIIEGDVPDGFEVQSDTEITVLGTVGDAYLNAAKKITVAGGVLGKENTRLESGGSIEVRFASHANLIAKGDVLVTRELLHCKVKTLGKLITKGKLIGGELSAREGIEAQDVGSENGIPTLVRVNFNYEIENIQDELAEIYSNASKVVSSIQSYFKNCQVPLEKLPMIKEIHQILHLCEAKANKLTQQMKVLLLSEKEREMSGKVKSQQHLYPGVRVESPGCQLQVVDGFGACQVLHNFDSGRMKVI